MTCAALHRSTAAPNLPSSISVLFALFALEGWSSAQNPRIGRIYSPRRPPGRPEKSWRRTALALRALAFPRPRINIARLGFASTRRCKTATPADHCFRRVPLAQSERRRTCRCGNLEGLDLGRAARPATHAAEPAARRSPARAAPSRIAAPRHRRARACDEREARTAAT